MPQRATRENYHLRDVTWKDGAAIAKLASDPRFFYVYINSNGRNTRWAGYKYAWLCDLLLQHRTAQSACGQASMLAQLYPQLRARIYQFLLSLAGLRSGIAKGLYDRNMLIGATVLLNGIDGRTEIGYFLEAGLQGQNITYAMVMSVLHWAIKNPFSSGVLNTLYGDVDPKNLASRKILSKLGLEENRWEYLAAGRYSERDGMPIAQMIFDGCTAIEVRAAVNRYVDPGNMMFPVSDFVPGEAGARKSTLAAEL